MKKPKMVADLLTVTDVCIEASEARAWLLDSCNKGAPKKKQHEDREVNVVDRGNQKQQPAEIHRTIGHDLEEYRTFLDHKKMTDKPAAQEP
jgi:hypothetical protein